MSRTVLSPSPTPQDSGMIQEQSSSSATIPCDHSDCIEDTHEESASSVTGASDHSDDTDDTASTQEEPSSPVTAPSDISNDAATSATSTDPKTSTPEAKTKEHEPLSKVQELAAWYDLQANGNLRLQVLTWDGRVVDAPKHESKKPKKSAEAEEGLM